MTLTIQQIIDGFKNTRDTTYRRLCCLKDARRNVCFEKKDLYNPDLPQPQEHEFHVLQRKALFAIDRMACIVAFGSDAGCAPNPHQELRDHLLMVKVANGVIKESNDLEWNEVRMGQHLDKAIELLEKIED